ncbi:MAG: 5-formyltetrahydrofolate cyclo-ligase [Bacteroidota bacterium]
MTKSQIRKAYRLLRKQLSAEDVEDLSLKIANQLLSMPIWDKTFYHIFLSIVKFNEVNTDYILNILSGKDKNIVLSKSDFELGKMTNYLLTDSTKIIINEYDIPEPVDGIEIQTSKIDVVFVPLLAFDKKGNRIGYGKGFYDRFLSECNPDILKIGLSFFKAEKEITGLKDFDIGLDYCVTPDEIYSFSSRLIS